MPHHPHTPFDDLEPAAVLTAVEVAERIRFDARSVRRAVARSDLTASRACGCGSWLRRGGVVALADRACDATTGG